MELARWLEDHEARLRERWVADIVGRRGGVEAGVRDLLDEFVSLLVPFVPAFLGPYREQIEPLWMQAAELYGSVAAMRGLAAGEVIEEFQILREELLRVFFDAPPVRDLGRLAPRDLLRLNRLLDLGVTHASVGHTDALFFALFQGSGVPHSLSGEQSREVLAQLAAVEREFRSVMSVLEERHG